MDQSQPCRSSERLGRHISASEKVFFCKKCERAESYRWSKTYAEAHDQDEGHDVPRGLVYEGLAMS